MRRNGLSFALAALIATPAAAQDKQATTYDRAIAAGYKALTLCSGIFNAGRTQAQVEALELTGIYPEYEKIVPTLAAETNTARRFVKVPFDAALPPREAHWAGSWRGCRLLPIGYPKGHVAPVQMTPPPPRAGILDTRAWPLGEAGIGRDVRPTTKFAQAIGAAFDGDGGTRTTSVVVINNGKIIRERYAEGFSPHTSQRTWSVAKSLSVTLIGHAAMKGALDVNQPARVDQWAENGDPRRAITIDNLLRMASGLHSDTAGNRTDAIYFGGTTVSEQATSWPIEAMPGTRFRYANNDTLLAVLTAEQTMKREGKGGLTPALLFDKIGMTRTVAETDWQGNFILSSQVWSTARDLARFGLLYLNDGVWNGERILPEGWVKYVTTPSGPQPEGEFGYGAGFWLMNKSPGIPADTFAAFGNRGQFVVIVPSRNIVIVRRGEDPTGARFDIARFTADVLAAAK